MNKLILRYIKPMWHNVYNNKAYSSFCIIGTALTFIFISIVLQLAFLMKGNTPPFINEDHIICIESFYDSKGDKLPQIKKEQIPLLFSNLRSAEGFYTYNSQMDRILIRGNSSNRIVAFVNAGFWTLNSFDFVAGGAFTDQDLKEFKKVVVIKESVAEQYFGSTDILNQELDFQNNTYKIIGVVRDFSMLGLSNPESLWLPDVFDKYFPNGDETKIYLMSKGKETIDGMKRELALTVKQHYESLHYEVAISSDKLNTVQESKSLNMGNGIFKFAIPIIVIILLIVPAINIMTLSEAGIYSRAEEIAIKRALGCTVKAAFVGIIIENMFLVMVGTFLGILAAKPALNGIMGLLLGGGVIDKGNMIPQFNYLFLISISFPLSVIFSFLSAGIPAYKVSNKSIINTLKGGITC